MSDVKLISKRHLRRRVANNVKLTLMNSVYIESCAERTQEVKFRDSSHLGEIYTVQLGNTENTAAYDASASNNTNINSNGGSCNNNDSFSRTDLPMLRDLITTEDFVSNETITSIESLSEMVESSSNNNSEDFVNKIKKWALDNNITHKAFNGLIQIIQPAFPFLRKDARTILKTPRKVEKFPLNNGEMIYLGVERGLRKKIDGGLNYENEIIFLKVNVDGIPLFKSSSIEFWPILVQSDCFKNTSPFAAAIFCGRGKPSPIETFLSSFVEECLTLLSEGLTYLDKKFKIEFKFFSCDAPARSYLKCVVGHTSRNGCERCLIKADRENFRNFYPVNYTYEARTDNDFLNVNLETSDTESYFKGKSPLLTLRIGLVSQFVLDPMHLIYQGVIKRLLLIYLLEGKRPYKLSKLAVSKINNQLLLVKKHTPIDFHRKIRTLSDIKRWKAVEYRFFLLYCGPLVLKNILEKEYYQHFLLLHCSVFILSNEELLRKYFLVAKEAIDKFIKLCPQLYDKFFVTYNVHSLSHLHEDVANYGPLENFSCFTFENYLGKLKSKIRGKTLPLGQIYNRLSELETITTNAESENNNCCPMFVRNINTSYFTCNKLKFNNILISTSPPDNVVAINKKIYIIEYIVHINGIYKIICTGFRYLEDFYNRPIKSSKLGIYFARGRNLSQDFFKLEEISCKYISIPFKNGFYVSPINHQKKL
ncbi:uncharacterized protein LOC135134383 isoform X1 [Zophobas morio]|uniref:uncharacterized protein LOC135134383 isoform X1 n=1 Tax=Zophobas morio TaxID=2755281 RepID=UPI003083778C